MTGGAWEIIVDCEMEYASSRLPRTPSPGSKAAEEESPGPCFAWARVTMKISRERRVEGFSFQWT